ncbi:MAG: hypothetical protein RL701_1046 [Pseudomonadota bacterium]
MNTYCRRALVLCAYTLSVVAITRVAAAQDSAPATMSQGEAAISVRSDVKLSVKGTGGTPSERLSKLGQAVSDELGEIRACYRKLVATSPEVTGALKLKIALERNKQPALEVVSGGAGSDSLVTCVTRILSRAKYTPVDRPAAAVLGLEFTNSRARGQAEMMEKAPELSRAPVHTNAAGQQEASWSTDANEVRFTVAADTASPPSTIELLIRGFTQGYAAFLDCRRKCEQGGISPEGDIDAKLALDVKGRSKITLGDISVAHKRAPGCAERAFKRVPFDKPGTPLQANVRVHFAP